MMQKGTDGQSKIPSYGKRRERYNSSNIAPRLVRCKSTVPVLPRTGDNERPAEVLIAMRRARVVPKSAERRPATGVSLRLRFAGHDGPLGPGKVQLLEEIERCGSISGAGRALHMSYHHAWTLVTAMNAMFREPLVSSRPGGAKGGGAQITDLGHDVIRAYRSMEAKLREHAAVDIEVLEAALADTTEVNAGF